VQGNCAVGLPDVRITGLERLAGDVLLSPVVPYFAMPQQYTEPLSIPAQLWYLPIETVFPLKLDGKITSTGVVLLDVLEPSPSKRDLADSPCEGFM
jgi:hypothetical protein